MVGVLGLELELLCLRVAVSTAVLDGLRAGWLVRWSQSETVSPWVRWRLKTDRKQLSGFPFEGTFVHVCRVRAEVWVLTCWASIWSRIGYVWPDGVAVPADAHGPRAEGRRPCGGACHELMRCEWGERRLRGFPLQLSFRVQQITAAVSLVFWRQRVTVHVWSWSGWVDRLAGWCDTVRSGQYGPRVRTVKVRSMEWRWVARKGIRQAKMVWGAFGSSQMNGWPVESWPLTIIQWMGAHRAVSTLVAACLKARCGGTMDEMNVHQARWSSQGGYRVRHAAWKVTWMKMPHTRGKTERPREPLL